MYKSREIRRQNEIIETIKTRIIQIGNYNWENEKKNEDKIK